MHAIAEQWYGAPLERDDLPWFDEEGLDRSDDWLKEHDSEGEFYIAVFGMVDDVLDYGLALKSSADTLVPDSKHYIEIYGPSERVGDRTKIINFANENGLKLAGKIGWHLSILE